MTYRIAHYFAFLLVFTMGFSTISLAHYYPTIDDGCTTCQAEDDPVLFTVNGKEVKVSEFVYIYNKTNGDKADFSEKSLKEYLELYINFKLQVAKGVDMGLDKDPNVVREQNQYKRQLSSTYLTDREITEKLVKEAYKRSLEDRKISHILVALNENAPEKDVREAYERIQKVKKQATGANFAELAAQYSDDSYSKKDGGNLGYFTVLQLPYELEEAVYETKKGEVSDIVRTKYGFHIVKVEDVRKAKGQVQVAHILLRKKMGDDKAKALADSLYQALQDGSKFETLASQYSQDNSTKARGGILGWVGINRYPADFEEAIFSLSQDGAMSKPVQSSAGWHVLKRIKAMKNPTYQEVKGELTNKIKRDERFQIVQDSLVARIKREAKYSEDKKVMDKLMEQLKGDKTFLQGRWNPPQDMMKSDEVIFKIGDMKATVKDFTMMAQRSPNERFAMQPRTVEAAVDRIVHKLATQKALQYEETQLDEKYPEFKALMREYEEGILLFEVKKQLVWDKASSDEEGLKKFYEANSDKYKWKERARVSFYTIRSTDKKLVKKIKKKAKKKTADEVKEMFNTENAVVQTTEATYEKGKNVEVDKLKWKAGTIGASYDKDGSTYFTKIEEVIPATTKSLDEARGYVVADYQDQLEKDLIKELRETYKVEIKENVLKDLVK